MQKSVFYLPLTPETNNTKMNKTDAKEKKWKKKKNRDAQLLWKLKITLEQQLTAPADLWLKWKRQSALTTAGACCSSYLKKGVFREYLRFICIIIIIIILYMIYLY